jgi:TrpR-related protein YerC/YecD
MAYVSKMQSSDLDLLFDAFLSMHSREECYRFFEDLATIQELRDFGQRFRVARLLDEKVPYQRITEETGMSAATIARVNRALVHGADGYRIALDRIRSES